MARINCLNNIYGLIDKKIHFSFGKHLNHIKQEIIKTIMVFPIIVKRQGRYICMSLITVPLYRAIELKGFLYVHVSPFLQLFSQEQMDGRKLGNILGVMFSYQMEN